MHSSRRRGLCGLVLLFGLVVFAPSVYGQVSLPMEGKGSVAGNSGAFTYSVPIEVPPGRHGLTPQLSLVYNSSAGNGFLGVGWDLPIGYVMRSTKYGVSYSCDPATSPNPCFVFMMGGASSELIRRPDICTPDCYGAKVEGAFMKFRYVSNTYWEVTDKTGTKYVFGQTSASRQDGAPGVFKWMLNTVTDTHNNTISYLYHKDQGEIYIDQINYQQNSIIFHRDPRSDALPMFVSNFSATSAYRLKTIAVWTNSNKVRGYKLSYNSSANTSRSLLAGVQQYDNNVTYDGTGTITGGSTLPAINFEYTDTASSTYLIEDYTSTSESCATDACGPWLTGDVNGDGKTDLFHIRKDVPGAVVFTWLSNGDGTYSINGYTSTSESCATDACGPWLAGDVNGDGRTDLIHIRKDVPEAVVFTWLSNGDGNYTIEDYTNTTFDSCTTDACGPWQVGDFNGDGKTDLIHFRRDLPNAVVKTWFSNGDGTYSVGSYTSTGDSCTTDACGPWLAGDVNGDGKTDLIHIRKDVPGAVVFTWLSNGDGNYTIEDYTSTSESCATDACGPWLTGDVNGDSRTDLIHIRKDVPEAVVFTWLSNGDGNYTIEDYTNTTFDSCTTDACGPWQVGDFNGDGKTDLIHFRKDLPNAVVKTWFSNGDGTYSVGSYTSTGDSCTTDVCGPWLMGDPSADGKTDLIHIRKDVPGAVVFTWLAQGSNGNSLIAITNGIGARTAITYKPSSEFWTSTDTTWKLPFVTQVATSIEVCDSFVFQCLDTANRVTNNYSYKGAFYNTKDREFHGFSYVKGTNAHNGNTTETWYHQGNGTGLAADLPCPPANPDCTSPGYTKGNPYRMEIRDVNGDLYSKKEWTYWDDADGAAPYFLPLQQEDRYSCDPGGGCIQTRAVTTYDDRFKDPAHTYTGVYGNLTKIEEHGNLSKSDDQRMTVRGFKPNATSWIVGLTVYEHVYPSLTATTFSASTVYHYDGATSQVAPTRGDLTQVGRWLNQGAGTGCDNFATGTCLYTNMTYDTYGNVLTTRDANNNLTTFCYDATATFLQSVTNAKSQVTKTEYHGISWNAACGTTPAATTGAGLRGQVKSVTDANSQQTTHRYDHFGRKIESALPDGGGTTWCYPSSPTCAADPLYVFNLFGKVGAQRVVAASKTAASSDFSTLLVDKIYFDGLGRKIIDDKTGPDGRIMRVNTGYNSFGQVDFITLPTSSTAVTRFEYDPLGRPITVTHPDHSDTIPHFSKTRYCYSLWSVYTLDSNRHMKRETKDAYGRLIQVDEYTGSYTACPAAPPTPYATTRYQYDVLGNLIKVTNAAGHLTTLRYDSLSRKIAMSDPDMGNCGDLTTLPPNTAYPWYAAPCWTYQYDSVGNLTRQTDAKGRSIFFRYDSLNRVVQKDYGTQKALGAGDVRYDYDVKYLSAAATDYPVGRLTRMTDSSGITSFGYDPIGRNNRTERAIDGLLFSLGMTYDAAGRVASISYPDGDIVYYNYNGPFVKRLYQNTSTSYVTYNGYNNMGQPSSVMFGNNVSNTFSYSQTGNFECPLQNFRLCRVTSFKNSVLQDMRFSYDAVGNVTRITDFVAPSAQHPGRTQNFTYDELNRLKTADGAYGNLTYHYNPLGNLLCNSALGPCNADAPNYTYGDPAHTHAVTQVAGTGYSYDANGNMTARGTDTLVYDDENRLTRLTNAAGTTSFVYDGSGNRVKKINGGVTKIYIGKYFECVSPCAPGGVWTGTKHLFSGAARIASKPITPAGEIYYYHTDQIGSTAMVTDQTGSNLTEYLYVPFGDTFIHTPGPDVHYQFTGQEKDAETALYFYNARYYDSKIGRFISADTIVQSRRNPQFLNRYSYTLNNPVRYSDPSGHSIAANTTTVGSMQNAFGSSSQFGCPPNCGVNLLTIAPSRPVDPSNNLGSSFIGATSPNGTPAPDFGNDLLARGPGAGPGLANPTTSNIMRTQPEAGVAGALANAPGAANDNINMNLRLMQDDHFFSQAGHNIKLREQLTSDIAGTIKAEDTVQAYEIYDAFGTLKNITTSPNNIISPGDSLRPVTIQGTQGLPRVEPFDLMDLFTPNALTGPDGPGGSGNFGTNDLMPAHQPIVLEGTIF